jgi:hypothetical protein
MLCEALAAAWLAGRAAPVRRLMLLPQGGTSEQVVCDACCVTRRVATMESASCQCLSHFTALLPFECCCPFVQLCLFCR